MLSDNEVLEIAKDKAIDTLNEYGYNEEDGVVDKVADIVTDFSVWTETRFWLIPEDDDTAPEDIVKTLLMRLAAELIHEHRVLSRMPTFSFEHNEETKKISRVGIEYSFRPILSAKG